VSNSILFRSSTDLPEPIRMKQLDVIRRPATALALALTLAGTVSAQCTGDDVFEPNDDCASTKVIPQGLTTGLRVFGPSLGMDDDYWVVQGVPTGSSLTIDTLFANNRDLWVQLFADPACSSISDYGSWLNLAPERGETVGVINNTGQPQNYSFRVYQGTGLYDCTDYDLQVTVIDNPCVAAIDDVLEPNDSCATARQLTTGTYDNLYVSDTDWDYYTMLVPPSRTVTAFAAYPFGANANLHMFLYDDPACSHQVWGNFAHGGTGEVHWTNNTGVTVDVQLLVKAPGADECNTYELEITGADGVLAIPLCAGDGSADSGGGPTGCPCANNSTIGAGEGCESSLGFGAKLAASGTSIVVDDDLVLTTTQARPNQPSMLVQGSAFITAPFKDGILCMGNPTERVEVVFLDASGGGSSVSSIVTEGNVSPGDVRYYQQWYRDPGGLSPCGSGSNFTQALMIEWM